MTNLFRLILPILPLFVGSIACNQQVKDDGRQGGMVGQKPGEYEAFVKGKPIAKKTLLDAPEKMEPVPKLNLHESREPPVPDNATEDMGRALIAGLAKGQPQACMAFALPKKVFLRMRDMHMSDPQKARRAAIAMVGRLHGKLLRRFSRLAKRTKYKGATFESIVLGKCSWIPPGKEWNRYGFWKCKNSTLYFHVEGDRRFMRLKTMMNWGAKWYLTDL